MNGGHDKGHIKHFHMKLNVYKMVQFLHWNRWLYITLIYCCVFN